MNLLWSCFEYRNTLVHLITVTGLISIRTLICYHKSTFYCSVNFHLLAMVQQIANVFLNDLQCMSNSSVPHKSSAHCRPQVKDEEEDAAKV